MMDGFGVHTFRLVNAQGKSTFVKFHWKPVLGAHSLVWDEALKIAGKDPDFHRRTMWDSIDQGNFFRVGTGYSDAWPRVKKKNFDFDILDATKDLARRLVSRAARRQDDPKSQSRIIISARRSRSPSTRPNIVPGIDFSDDPLLQGRNFSYSGHPAQPPGKLRTSQNYRSTGPWPTCPITSATRTCATPSTRAVSPTPPPHSTGTRPTRRLRRAAASSPTRSKSAVPKVRQRSESFGDHYGQAKLFWNSMTPPEKEHIAKALQFELSKVETKDVRQRMLGHLRKDQRPAGRTGRPGVGRGGQDEPPDGHAGRHGGFCGGDAGVGRMRLSPTTCFGRRPADHGPQPAPRAAKSFSQGPQGGHPGRRRRGRQPKFRPFRRR